MLRKNNRFLVIQATEMKKDEGYTVHEIRVVSFFDGSTDQIPVRYIQSGVSVNEDRFDKRRDVFAPLLIHEHPFGEIHKTVKTLVSPATIL